MAQKEDRYFRIVGSEAYYTMIVAREAYLKTKM